MLSSHHSEDFEFIITSKNKEALKGKIIFQYLEQQFEANILISPSTIQIKSQYPFAGIQSSAPILAVDEIAQKQYLQSGSLTKNGHQNILWLILDSIHLYNLIRLKSNAVLNLYREAFSFAKDFDQELIFANIQANAPIAKATANFLAQQMKRKYKYAYGNNVDLLMSIQQLLENYPQAFLRSKTVLNTLSPVLS